MARSFEVPRQAIKRERGPPHPVDQQHLHPAWFRLRPPARRRNHFVQAEVSDQVPIVLRVMGGVQPKDKEPGSFLAKELDLLLRDLVALSVSAGAVLRGRLERGNQLPLGLATLFY